VPKRGTSATASRQPATLAIYGVLFLIYAAYGDLEVACVRGFPTGGYSILLSGWAIGGITGATVLGLRRRTDASWRRARLLLVAAAAVLLSGAPAWPNIWWLAAVLFFFGCTGTPGVSLIFALVSDAAGTTDAAPVYSRISAVTWIGNAAGAALLANTGPDRVIAVAGVSASFLLLFGAAGLWRRRAD